MKQNKYNWKHFWDDQSKKDHFVSMGRSAYSLDDFNSYFTNVIKNLSPISNKTKFLDCGGGIGLFSWIIYPFVKEIYLTDYSKEMIKQAKKRFKGKKKIRIYLKDVRNLQFKKNLKFDRILFGSVLQYLEDYNDIDIIFKSLKKITSKNSKILFTQNPNIFQKSKHLKSYKKLKWKKSKILKSLIEEEKRFWINFNEIKKIANNNGFKATSKINKSKGLYENSHMFDFLLYK